MKMFQERGENVKTEDTLVDGGPYKRDETPANLQFVL